MLIRNSYATAQYPEFHCKQHRCEDSFVEKKETSSTAPVTFFFFRMQLCVTKSSGNIGIDFMEYEIKSFLSYIDHISKIVINYFYK